MCPPGTRNRSSLPTVPLCRLCGEKSRVVEVGGVFDGAHYWRCGDCGSVWASRDDEAMKAAERSPTSAERRTTGSGSTPSTTLDAVSARTRVLLNSREIRATVRSPYGKTFTVRCVRCRQAGRKHDSALTFEQRYICARCYARWTVQPSAS